MFILISITTFCAFKSLDCSAINMNTLQYKSNGLHQALWLLVTGFFVVVTVLVSIRRLI